VACLHSAGGEILGRFIAAACRRVSELALTECFGGGGRKQSSCGFQVRFLENTPIAISAAPPPPPPCDARSAPFFAVSRPRDQLPSIFSNYRPVFMSV